MCAEITAPGRTHLHVWTNMSALFSTGFVLCLLSLRVFGDRLVSDVSSTGGQMTVLVCWCHLSLGSPYMPDSSQRVGSGYISAQGNVPL